MREGEDQGKGTGVEWTGDLKRRVSMVEHRLDTLFTILIVQNIAVFAVIGLLIARAVSRG